MTEIERLAAIEAIKQLKARYFRALDCKDMASYAAVFTPEARIDVRGSVTGDEQDDQPAIADFDEDAVIVGGAAMAAFVERIAADIVTAHHGHTPEIEILGDDHARGVWAFEDRLWFPESAPHRLLHGFGHYHETYRRHSGIWLIDSMTITRLRVNVH